MTDTRITSRADLREYLQAFRLDRTLFSQTDGENRTAVDHIDIAGQRVPRFINEFWTAKQRQASSLHEVAYRACFKGQLPRFFIKRLSSEGDVIYDPFSGRGTTAIEAALLGRNVIANDINPLSRILAEPRLRIPGMAALAERLEKMIFDASAKADIDLAMFYHPKTEAEIVSLKNYLQMRRNKGTEDALDAWIRMIATNRLTGHSPGFFSVYTLPPNQAVSQESQRKINEKRAQSPDYRDIKKLILRKSKSLLRGISGEQAQKLGEIAQNARFLTCDARKTLEIPDQSVQLTVTSPPFLNVVQYSADNWLRCWFNNIDAQKVAAGITMARTLEDWNIVMGAVFQELFRITRPGGWVAFEVGEVRNGRIKLDEHIVPLGIAAGFQCVGIVINQQNFTKTSNIWGVKNNAKGTNSNRIVLFQK